MVIETSLHYDARSEKHQISFFIHVTRRIRYFPNCEAFCRNINMGLKAKCFWNCDTVRCHRGVNEDTGPVWLASNYILTASQDGVKSHWTKLQLQNCLYGISRITAFTTQLRHVALSIFLAHWRLANLFHWWPFFYSTCSLLSAVCAVNTGVCCNIIAWVQAY